MIQLMCLVPSNLPPFPFYVFGPIPVVKEISNIGPDALEGKHLAYSSSVLEMSKTSALTEKPHFQGKSRVVGTSQPTPIPHKMRSPTNSSSPRF
jgi:hypothetical protein